MCMTCPNNKLPVGLPLPLNSIQHWVCHENQVCTAEVCAGVTYVPILLPGVRLVSIDGEVTPRASLKNLLPP
jgi:hypothetical protein